MDKKNTLDQTTTLLQAGEYKQAEKLIRPWVQENPKDAEAHERLGLALLLDGQHQNARLALMLASKLKPDIARYHCNLGECLRQLEEFDLAEEHLQQALSIQPDYADASYNLACTLLKINKQKEALVLLRQLLQKKPHSSRYHSTYADLLRETGKPGPAIAHYKKALEYSADYAPAHSNLGPLLLATGKIDDALKHCRRALELEPQSGLAHVNLGRCLASLEQLDEAMDAYADAYALIPKSVLLLTCIGKAWLEVSDLPQSEYWFMLALEQDQNDILAKCGLADCHREAGLLDKALSALNEIVEANPESPHGYKSRAQTYLDIGDTDSCIKDYRRMLELRPQQASIHASLGSVMENAGDLTGAETEMHLALQKNPACIPALKGLATTQKGKLSPEYVTKMSALIGHQELRDGAKAALHSGLGYHYDGKQEFDQAAEHINLGNHYYWLSKSRKGWSYDPDDFRRKVDQTMAVFDAGYFAELNTSGNQSQMPAFILGMPRSGTTLTEQILNAHPEILGIGERSHVAESLSLLPKILGQNQAAPLELVSKLQPPHLAYLSARLLAQLDALVTQSNKQGVQRVVDKMPDNYLNLGWILTLFPQAHIIHAKRDVRDVAVSCWMTQFGKIRWAFDLKHLAERIIQYDRLMKHWRSVLPGRYLETDYEAIVMDQEIHSRKLIDFLGLDWSPDCLNFHQQKAVVRTASVTQVREPIYKKSLQRWKRYESVLEPLLERLAQAGVDTPEL